jgi:hypothetical protein
MLSKSRKWYLIAIGNKMEVNKLLRLATVTLIENKKNEVKGAQQKI